MEEKKVVEIRIEDIIPNPFQPRMSFREEKIQELSASIKVHGIIQPLLVRPVGEKYEIVVGERRYKAAVMAGLTTVPAVISVMDDNQSAEVALVENLLRKDLTPIEEAKAYEKLQQRGYSQEDIAKKMGISQSSIANKIRLLNLDEEVQQALLEEKISERHARSLLKISDINTQKNLLNKIISERLTVKQLDEEIKAIIGESIPENVESLNMDSGDESDNLATSSIETPFADINNLIESPIETLSSEEEAINPIESFADDNISNINEFPPVQPENLMSEDLITEEVNVSSEIDTTNSAQDMAMPDFTSFEENTPESNFTEFTPPPFESLSDNSMINSNEEVNPFQKTDEFSFPEPNFIEASPSPFAPLNKSDAPATMTYNISKEDFSTVIKAFENIKEKIEEAGLTIDMETFNFDEYYQLIIKVHKN